MLAAAAAVPASPYPLLGETCAFVTAVVWAFALVLFKLSGERISPLALNLFKNTVALVLFALTLGIMVASGVESVTALRANTPPQIGILLLSGLLGIAIADTLFFKALNLIGVGLISIVDCTYSPLAIVFAWALLGEKLAVVHYVGMALVLAGVFTITQHKVPVNRTRAQIAEGVLLAIIAIALMAFGIVLAKPVLKVSPVVWATTIRLIGGFGGLVLFAVATKDGRQHWRVFRPAPSWKYALPASLFGAYVCLMLWVAGFKYTQYAAVAAILNQTSVVFQAALAALILKEPFGRRKLVAFVLALAGAAIVALG